MTGSRNAAAMLVALALFASALPGQAVAGFEEGVKAYEAGNFKTAFDEWLPLARANDPAAMRNIGHLYRRGLGVQQDFKQAMNWYKRAATLGFDRAQANVAGMYLNGEGVERNFIQAASWFARAAEQGHVLARYNLGLMFENGLGVNKNLDKAKALFRLAAEDGHPQARERLALLEARGDEPRDPDKPIVVAIERPPEPPQPPAEPLAAEKPPAAEKPVPAAPAIADQEVEPAPSVAESESAPEKPAPEPVKEVAKTDPTSGQKKGFYAALKSFGAKKSAKPETVTVAPAPEKPAPVVKTTPEPEATTIVKAPEPETPTVSRAAAEPEETLVVAKAEPPAAMPAPVSNSTPNGLTLQEKLEMADLTYALEDYQQSLSIWAVLAQQGNAEAQYKLGTMFHNGLAVPVDRVRAYYWWEKAKENGYAEAATALAGLEKSLTYMEKRQIQHTN